MIRESDLKAALPDLTTPRRFPQLRSGAVIRRDQWGIPHIKSQDEYDLFFAQGFATAQDRLFQMDFDRLRALGRSAEYLGYTALPQDRLMRRRRFERVSKLDYEVTSDAGKAALNAYADGVNAFIQTTEAWPIEYKLLDARPELWEAWHSIVVFKVRNTAEGSFQGKLWLARLAAEIGPENAARLSPGYQPSGLLTVPPGARFHGPLLNAIEELQATVNASSTLQAIDGGSNAWVVRGDLTESQLPLLAGDPHRTLEAPNVYYQVHLIGRDFQVLGFSIPGVPMALHFCHNEHVSWGMTNGNVDTQDLFVERFRRTGTQLEYLYQDQWLPAETADELIKVRGGPSERLEVVETHHGPVIAGDPHAGIAMTLADPACRDGTRWVDAAYCSLKSRRASDLEEALRTWTDRTNNYVYADVDGNFGYLLRGRVPIRPPSNGWGPVPGWTGAHEWRGYIPVNQLPSVSNPANGWVVSCNQRVASESYPHYLTNFHGAPYRAERITERIVQLQELCSHHGRKIKLEDFAAIHADTKSIPARTLRDALARYGLLQENEISRVLRDWDCTLSSDSAAAAVYEMTAAKLTDSLARYHYGNFADELLNLSDPGASEHWQRHLKPRLYLALEQGDATWLPENDTWPSLLARALESAMHELNHRLGPTCSKWRWGTLHPTAHRHPLAELFPEVAELLNPPRVDAAGDGDTPLVSNWAMASAFSTRFASVARYIHDPSDWSRGRWVVPLGASGHPGSAHYSDQQCLWAKVDAIPQLWSWEDIERSTETEQALIRSD